MRAEIAVYWAIPSDLRPLNAVRLAGDLGLTRAARYYEPLAHYFAREAAVAEVLLHLCVTLLGGTHVTAILAMLLHRWLMSDPAAGGVLWRTKHIRIMVQGVLLHPAYGTKHIPHHAMSRAVRLGNPVCTQTLYGP